ncbi:ABC-F family ATP-binding cassette domain-containing protein [Azotobacter salinestris]|uniref:ABC-F family ATP-binding cassette domain-containing protein n=1 Tax=Azotobacter salinestris TaxID=69964 RepID=UPI001266A933|nr:ABC-F family ATP-binding cassette domain-containing protein [Azotobacter salinestris]
MMNPYLALDSLSYVLSDGRTLFSNLTEQFDQQPTGLVGRNGIGKTVLARILAGELEPSTGRCLRSGTVHYLSQQVSRLNHVSVASLAGVQATLNALERIEAGSTAQVDFDAVGDCWDVRQRLQHELVRNGLGHLNPQTPASTLSGGEAMRVALIGAVLSDADFLILDEPSNHLDRPNRQALIEQLQRWPNGLLVVSHDRQLLEVMARIVELSPLGLRNYGGGYSFYAQCKALERESAIQQLEQRKLERKREEQSLREQCERQERRQARGNRHGREANQAKILLDRQKERSEGSAGKLRQQQTALREQLSQRVRDAAQQVEDDAQITLHTLPVTQAPQRRVAALDEVELPFVPPALRKISLTLSGQQRIGVVGPNGCGKSTLLKLLAGQFPPVSGRCNVYVKSAYLDQQLADLVPQRSTIEQILAANSTAGEDVLRTRLAQLGLDAQKITAPSGSLSGGERLKAALACVLYADPPAQLLLLDEPSNHLDLPSVQALESMLRGYQGAILVVSHDDTFLNNLSLTDRLVATLEGWRLELW